LIDTALEAELASEPEFKSIASGVIWNPIPIPFKPFRNFLVLAQELHPSTRLEERQRMYLGGWRSGEATLTHFQNKNEVRVKKR
jgi:hypothetical protein